MRSRRSRATEIKPKVRQIIKDRDGGCIFCQMGYHLDAADDFGYQIPEIMHLVSRSRGGLGIEQNLAMGCKYHHTLMDNGNKGLHEEMAGIFADYLRRHYSGWTEKSVTYAKF